MGWSSPGFPVLHHLPELVQSHVHWAGDAIQPSHPLLIVANPLLLLSSVFPSIRVFSSESVLCIRWPNYWSFSHSLFSEYSELISFRVDWFDLLAGQGTRKSLPEYHSSFVVQCSHPNMTTGKTIGLTKWTFVGKVTCLCFLICCLGLSAFLPRSKCL